ncbi:MAG: SpoIIE family protein phosphatase [Lentisphaeraceae bacterium]|nr:SpoIIE family protein phosphatase [Lentisphaeraceae bacterium]
MIQALSLISVLLLVLLVFYLKARTHIKILEHEAVRSDKDRRAVVNFLNRFAHSVSTVDDIDNAIISLARYTKDAMHAQSLCIFFTDGRSKELSAKATIGAFPALRDFDSATHFTELELNTKTFAVGKGFIGKIAETEKPILITSAEDPLLANALRERNINTVLAVPIVLDRELKGLICAVNTVDGRSFTQGDLELLISVSGHATLARNMIETYEKMGEQQRIHQELEFAREMQASLMPPSTPEGVTRFDVYAYNNPAKEVSGDFFDFIRVDENRLLLVVGDASGKGVPACMIMTMTRSILRSLCANFTSLEEILMDLNEGVYNDTEASKFITLALCLIDESTSNMEVARAGHTELLLKNRQGEIFPLAPDGPAIGLLPNEFGVTFETYSSQFYDGYSLLVFTDGITEALNDYDEEYGVERLVKLWGDCGSDADGQMAVQAILNDVERFAGDMPQLDDQTLMVITSKGGDLASTH